MSSNYSAFVDGPGSSLRIAKTTIPVPGPSDIVVRNRAVAVNTIDPAQAGGFNVKRWPTVLGHDLAGEVFSVGSRVTRFRRGDRVIGHSHQFLSGDWEDGAFSLYSRIPAGVAAVIPANIEFKQGVVLPLAIDTAACGLYKDGMMGLDPPSLDATPNSKGKVLVVYGGSTSVGIAATQLAVSGGYRVVATASPKNFDLVRKAGVSQVFDYREASLADDIADAVGKDESVGLYNAIGIPESYEVVIPIMEKLGGGFVATTKPPGTLPSSINAKFVLGVGDFSFPIWERFVTSGLESGRLKCLPEAKVVGQGLGSLQKAFEIREGDVSGYKVVVEL